MRALAVVVFTITAVVVEAQSRHAEFDVASLKRNTGAQSPFGSPSDLPSGEIHLINVPMRFLVGQAYPGSTVPVRIENLPTWADESYDLDAKGTPHPSRDERAQMIRSLLEERTKLAAHFETRRRHGYHLTFAHADHRLGPSLTRSTRDCSSPQPSVRSVAAGEASARDRCGLFHSGQTMTSGGVTIDQFVRSISALIGQPVVDRTDLIGLFALTFTFQHGPPRTNGIALPDDPPTVFAAIQEQLGLALEPATVDAQVLVIDHIERPAGN